jgi:hypothetical protein
MARKASSKPADATANLGFETKLRLAANKLRNNMDALPSQLFFSMQIPACLWFTGKIKIGCECLAASKLGFALAA